MAYADQLRNQGVAVDIVRMRPGDADVRVLRRLRGELAQGRHHVVHAHLVHADWFVAAASVGIRAPALVSTKHNHDPFRERPLFRAAERMLARRYDAIIAISDSLATFVELTVGRRPVVIRYGLNADGASTRVGVGRPAELLGVGRLEPQKGWDVAIKAMPEVLRALPEARLRIAGEGSERLALERLRDELGLGDRIMFLGRRENVDELMQSANILVHPARWEGFGLVLLEAMRAGLPIVASAVGGIPEVLDGGAGVLVPAEDPSALARAIDQLATDEALARRLAEEADGALRSRFSPDRMAGEHAALYDALVRVRSPRIAATR